MSYFYPNLQWLRTAVAHSHSTYVFDDTLIMSGANLSGDYFTTRQDRYWVIRDAQLASFYHNLVSALRDASRPHDCGPRCTPPPPRA